MNTDPVTDRAVLAGSAYRTGDDLAVRQSLYQWQTPRYDLPGLVAERLRDVRGTVLDLGCGNGRYTSRIRVERADLTVVGMDVSPGILAGVPAPVVVGDVARLPVRDGGADAVLALHMLYHVADIPAAVSELNRVVVGGGPVIVSTNGERDKHELDALWARAAADVLGVAEGPSRLSLSARFSLERAPGFLRPVFPEIETIGLPGTISLTDPAPVVAHLRSYRAWADRYDVPFDAAVDRARELVAEHIRRHGAFTVTTHSGILVCRRGHGR
ncbi:class I SAM-dependent methyltransferase [Streptomyces sp. NPDC020875]|uniref:class I SAM-dependent methyltransferase n=1 Tax=Streptomyces sp. NPDC020875 TaxID=3154898 RepID=UPI0033ED1DBC